MRQRFQILVCTALQKSEILLLRKEYHHFEGKVDLEVSRTLYNLSLCYYDIE